MAIRNLRTELHEAQDAVRRLKQEMADQAFSTVQGLPESQQKLLAAYGLNRLMELGIDKNALAPSSTWSDLLRIVNTSD